MSQPSSTNPQPPFHTDHTSVAQVAVRDEQTNKEPHPFCITATLFETGMFGAPKDITTAQALYERACAEGDTHAMYALADLLLIGDLIPQNMQAGVRYLMLANERGHFYAKLRLASYALVIRCGISQRTEAATRILDFVTTPANGTPSPHPIDIKTSSMLQASTDVNLESMITFASLLLSQSGGLVIDLEIAKSLYAYVARDEHSGLASNVARLLLQYDGEISRISEYGACAPEQPVDGKKHPPDASKFGRAAAMSDAAVYYWKGLYGVTADIHKAKMLFRAAIDLGHAPAMHNLGAMLLELGEDFLEAKNLLQQAANLGYADAMMALADLLRKGGVGIKRNPPAAMELLERAVEHSHGRRHVWALSSLASMLSTGDIGVRRDMVRAKQLFDRAASGALPDNAWAKTNLAQIILSEEPEDNENRARAIELLESAAEQDNFDMAHHELAVLYEREFHATRSTGMTGSPEATLAAEKAAHHFQCASRCYHGDYVFRAGQRALLLAGPNYHSIVRKILRISSTKPRTCLLLTLGAPGRGKTATLNSLRGMPFVGEHIPTEMAALSMFVIDPGVRSLEEDLITELDFNENSLLANISRLKLTIPSESKEKSETRFKSSLVDTGFFPVKKQSNSGGSKAVMSNSAVLRALHASRPLSPLHAGAIEQVRRSVTSNPIPKGAGKALVRCWDMAGQSEYEMAHSLVIKHADIIVFVVNLQKVRDQNSREREVGLLCYWMQLAHVTVRDPSRVKALIVGTHRGDNCGEVLQVLYESLQLQLGSAVFDTWIRKPVEYDGDDQFLNIVALENRMAEKNPMESGLEDLELKVKVAAEEVVEARSHVPTRWFGLMDALERSEKSYFPRAEVEELGTGFPGFDPDEVARNKDIIDGLRCFASMGRLVLFELEDSTYYVFMDVDRIIALLGKVTAPEKRLKNRLSGNDINALRRGEISREALFKLWDGRTQDEKKDTLKLLCRFDLLMMLKGEDESGQEGSGIIGVPALLPRGWRDFSWRLAEGEFDMSVTTQFVDAVPLGLVGMLMAYLHRMRRGRTQSVSLLDRFRRLIGSPWSQKATRPSLVRLVRADAAFLTTEDGGRVFVGFNAAKRQLQWKFRGLQPANLAKAYLFHVEKLLMERMNLKRKHVILHNCEEPCGTDNGIEIELSPEWWNSAQSRLSTLNGLCMNCGAPWNAEDVIEAQRKCQEAQCESPSPEPVMPIRMYDVFISHAGPDKLSIARPIYNALELHDVHCFLDMEILKGSADSAPELMYQAMNEARLGIFILSPEFAARKWTLLELRRFLDRNAAKSNEAAWPVLLPVFARLDVRACESVYEDEEYAEILKEEKCFEPERLAECSVDQAKTAMKAIKTFSGVEKKRIGGGSDLSSAEIVDETVRRVLNIFGKSPSGQVGDTA